MSSPFGYFRKRQKAFLAVATVFIVFVFVVGSALDPGSGRPDDRGDQNVATWNGGSLSAEKLATLVRNRRLTSQFVRTVVGEGIRSGGKVENLGLPGPLVDALAVDPQATTEQLESLVLSTEIIAGLAEGAGMSVSDGVVNRVLSELGSRRVRSTDVGAIMQGLFGNNAQAAEGVVFSTIKRVLLTYFYQQSFGDAAATITPAQRWEQWLRTNERISLQAAVLPVDSFASEVPDPTDAQLAAFYEEFKERDPAEQISVGGVAMPSPSPGFAKPRRVKLHFLRGSVSDRAETLLDTVTDQEIADYYEANKRYEFIKSSLPGADAEEDEQDEDEEAAADESEDSMDSADESESTEEERVEVEDDEEDSPPAGAEAAAATEEATPADGEGAAMRRTSPFRLAAFQTEGAEEADVEDSAVAADDSAAPDNNADADEVAATGDPGAEEEGEEEEPEYEPLEAVKEDIRREIARRKAIDAVQSDMRSAYELLRNRYGAYRRAVAAAEKEKQDLPELPDDLTDLASLAEKYGFAFEKTASLTQRQLYNDTQIGRAIEPDRQEEVVAEAAFGRQQSGEPYFAREPLGDCYVAVKVEDEPRMVPALADIRDRVEAAWRRVEAAKLAGKKAQELAGAAKAADRSFVEFLGDKGYQIIDPTEMFSWQSFGLVAADQIAPRISTVPGLENVGNDFMKAAFELQGEDVGSAMNVDRSAAYVFRVATRERTLEQLKQDFLKGGWNTRDQRIGVPLGLMQRAGTLSAQRGLDERVGLEVNPEWQRERMEQLEGRE